MNRLILICVAACSLLSFGSRATAAQTASDLFQQALRKERVDGDIVGAIALYQRILKQYPMNRSLGASALVQLGAAYEKQGSAEARAAYQRVVRDFSDEPDQVTRARARLDSLESNSSDRPSGPTLRRVWEDAPGGGGASADGQILSFTDRQTGRLGVHDQSTGETRMLTEAPQRAWQAYSLGNVPSRDGKYVAYAWHSEQQQNELRVISIRGGEPRIVSSNQSMLFIAPLDWSPDGKQILAFTVRKDRVGQISVISTLDGKVRVLKTFGWRVAPGRMAFSPDGKVIAYNFAPRDDSDARDIYLLAADASSESVLANATEDEQFLAWTPDGKEILYASGQPDRRSIWIARVQDGKRVGKATLVRRDAGDVQPMGITDRGTFLFSAVAPAPIRAYSVALDSAAPTQASTTPINVSRPEAWAAQWSHDGRMLGYASSARPDESRPTHVIVRSESNGSERVVPAMELGYAYSMRWSPDDRYLMIVGQDKKGRRGVFRVDPTSGATTLVIATEAGADGVFAGWTADGGSIIYLENTGPVAAASAVVRRRDLQTGDERELARLPGLSISSPKLSPDSKRLAFVSRDAADVSGKSLNVVELTGGSPNVTTLARGPDVGSFTWSADGRSLYYAISTPRTAQAAAESAKTRVMRVPAAGGAPTETGIAIASDVLALQMHPSGERLLFTAYTSSPGQRDVWAMDNFLPKAKSDGSARR